MKLAHEAGARVRAFDPVADRTGAEAIERLGFEAEIVGDMYDCLDGADALVVSTDWDEFKHPDFGRIAERLGDPVIFDGRNLYKREQMRELGFDHYSVGRPSEVRAV